MLNHHGHPVLGEQIPKLGQFKKFLRTMNLSHSSSSEVLACPMFWHILWINLQWESIKLSQFCNMIPFPDSHIIKWVAKVWPYLRNIQGDTSGWAKAPVDIKTKVPFLPVQVRPDQAKMELLFWCQWEVWLNPMCHPVSWNQIFDGSN